MSIFKLNHVRMPECFVSTKPVFPELYMCVHSMYRVYSGPRSGCWHAGNGAKGSQPCQQLLCPCWISRGDLPQVYLPRCLALCLCTIPVRARSLK